MKPGNSLFRTYSNQTRAPITDRPLRPCVFGRGGLIVAAVSFLTIYGAPRYRPVSSRGVAETKTFESNPDAKPQSRVDIGLGPTGAAASSGWFRQAGFLKVPLLPASPPVGLGLGYCQPSAFGFCAEQNSRYQATWAGSGRAITVVQLPAGNRG
jgi:hypothetical protein